MGIFVAFSSIGFTISSAVADPNQINVDKVVIVDQNGNPIHEATDGDTVWLQIEMSSPEHATSPVTGTISLPPELVGIDDKFPITDPAGDRNGECRVYASYLSCTIDEEYVNTHPEKMRGGIRFRVQLNLGNEGDKETDFPVGGEDTNVIVAHPKPAPLPPILCTVNCEWQAGGGYKGGGYNNVEDMIEWYVETPGQPDGITPGSIVQIIDHMDLDQFSIRDGFPVVTFFDHTFINNEGREILAGRSGLDESEYTVSADRRTVTLTAAPGHFAGQTFPEGGRGLTGRIYFVQWFVDVLDGGAAGHYENSATVTINGVPTADRPYEAEANRISGEGIAVGQTEGGFTLTKELDGITEGDPGVPIYYRVDWRACNTLLPDYDPVTHSGTGCTDKHVDLAPGQIYYSDILPQGTRVVATEVTPTSPEHVTWDGRFQLVDQNGDPILNNGNPIYGSDDPAILDITFDRSNSNLGKTTYYQLTNIAHLNAFQVTKAIDNPDDVDLDDHQKFTLEYTYTYNGSTSATQPLLVTAGTAPVWSAEVPVGATVTVREVLPEDVPGATWGGSGSRLWYRKHAEPRWFMHVRNDA